MKKTIILLMLLAISATGCYVPMPSVGITSPRVHHKKVCWHSHSGHVHCKHIRYYTR